MRQGLERDSACAVADLVAENNSLVALDLRVSGKSKRMWGATDLAQWIDIGDDGAAQMAEALAKNDTLKELRVCVRGPGVIGMELQRLTKV